MKSQKQIIYDACEKLENGDEELSCVAICNYTRFYPSITEDNLRLKYANFYDKVGDYPWEFSQPVTKDGIQERIIALLLFAEVEL
jgi:hypothetical protein